jgi:hypothetical protein
VAHFLTSYSNDAGKEKAVSVVDCDMGDAADAGCGERTGMSNSRAVKLLIRVNGMYFGKFGWTRRFLCEKIILGERPAIMIWFPKEITVEHERKWCSDVGTCQESRRRNKIDLPVPLTTTRTYTSPMPSMTILVPKTVRWSRREGMYVVNKERSLNTWDGRVVSTTRWCGCSDGDVVLGRELDLRWEDGFNVRVLDDFEVMSSKREKNKKKEKWLYAGKYKEKWKNKMENVE